SASIAVRTSPDRVARASIAILISPPCVLTASIAGSVRYWWVPFFLLDFVRKGSMHGRGIPSEQGYPGQRPALTGLEVVQVPEWSGSVPIARLILNSSPL